MKNQTKIIFVGPTGSGKTTAIEAVSDIELLKTEAKPTEAGIARYGKESTTVALDYGRMQLADDQRIHLYGSPGQDRFDFMWEILSEGALGMVLLIDNARDDPFADLKFFTSAFQDLIRRTGLAIGVTRMDLNPYPGINEYRQELKMHGLNPPVFTVDARVKRDVALLLEALLYSIEPELEPEPV